MIIKAVKSSLVSKMLDVSEYTLAFNMPRFLLLFSYHMLFFIFGPFSLPIIIGLSGKGLAENMAIYSSTSLKASFFVQYLQWLCNIAMFTMWVKDRPPSLDQIFTENFYRHGIYIE
jgi:hypothetical protein